MTEIDPTPELPDDTPLESVRFAARVRSVLAAAGMRTVGDVREAHDGSLLCLPDLGKGSLCCLRAQLGLPSSDGVRPVGTSPRSL